LASSRWSIVLAAKNDRRAASNKKTGAAPSKAMPHAGERAQGIALGSGFQPDASPVSPEQSTWIKTSTFRTTLPTWKAFFPGWSFGNL
jgi:hypothetical protein